MNLQSMAVLSSLALASAAGAQTAVQWRVEDGGNGHWYQLVVGAGEPLAWEFARDRAVAAGGYLATLVTAAENDFAFSVSQFSDGWQVTSGSPTYCVGPWLGGYQPRGSTEPLGGWRWVTDEPWSWTNWWAPAHEPNNGCGGGEDYLQWLGQGTANPSSWWNDGGFPGGCGVPSPRSYLVEWSADCNNDGIVDYGQCRDGTLSDYNSNNVPDCCEQGTACVIGNYPVQWRVEDVGNGHWYSLRPAACWSVAQSAAQAEGGYLATLTSAGERQFVGALVPSTDDTFTVIVGGSRLPSSSMYTGWTWVTGESFVYAAGEWMGGNPGCCAPNEFFLCVNRQGLLGDTAECDTSRVVLEWSADCNNDGIVDYGQILRGELADTNANGVPDICEPCMADIVQDGLVNGIDLAAVLNNWGTKGGVIDADVNNDGVVDGADLALVLNAWGPCP